jgi:hypothetical protein
MRQFIAVAPLLAAAALSFVAVTGLWTGGKPRPCDLTPAPDVDTEAVEVRDFARLTPAELVRREGRRAVYHVRLTDELGEQRGRCVFYSVAAPGDEPAVLTLPAHVRDDELTVEAELHIEYVPAKVGKDGTPFPAAWVYRLEKAAVVRE